ncbi:Two-component hybrid sensor and regulator [Minicystis rosea]|nr:Two-component hybrid sensor and regulator [Minicystis rosea]
MRRIIVIDDNPSIHEDFRKILNPPARARGGDELNALESALFGSPHVPQVERGSFEIHTAVQGREGFELVSRMLRIGRPIAAAFIDMRMPPGWDGVETAAKIWSVDPEIEIAICSAYSDYSWQEVIGTLKRTELRLLRKPFETREVLDLAWGLTNRRLRRQGAPRT